MKQRAGVTLIEVLVSIFVMGIGLLAVLTLFPLGALTMAQAIRDDRCAHCASTGASIAVAFNMRSDASVTAAYSNPNGVMPPAGKNATGPYTIPVGYKGPSFAVYVDPFGWYSAFPGQAQNYVGGANAPSNIPRVTPSFITAANTSRWFLSPDDIRFGTDDNSTVNTGVPDPPYKLGPPNPAPEIDREGNYSWAFLLQNLDYSDTTYSNVNLSVIVYNKRALRLTAGVNPNETTYDATFSTTDNRVRLTWNPAAGQIAPDLRAGSWFLDGTVETDPNNAGAVVRPHGTFYRVREVLDTNLPNTIDVVADSPLQNFSQTGTAGKVMILADVAEVFFRGAQPWRTGP
jgi:prepilin-type N-terminal cleavage/methylation domain-containing protein